MISLTDDLGEDVRLNRAAERIVCLVPSITETLFAFGAGERIVGVTDYCIHPGAGVANKARIGGTKNILIEKIVALRPDLVIANAEENRKHQVAALRRAGVRVFVTFPKTVDGCLKMMRNVAELTETRNASLQFISSIETAREQARALAREPRPTVLCPIWKKPYMSVNRDTFIDSMIREAGGSNVFKSRTERYPEFTLEEAARERPDCVILPTEPYHFEESDVSDFIAMGEAVPAVRNHRIFIVEGELLSWYGPRVAGALDKLSTILNGGTRSVSLEVDQ